MLLGRSAVGHRRDRPAHRAAAASCAGKPGENGYRCSIEYLVRGEQAKEGDKVVTSGLGGAFPRDLAVGKVSRVVPGAVGLYQEVEVTPDVDFARLSEVLVVVAPPARARSRGRRAQPPGARPRAWRCIK